MMKTRSKAARKTKRKALLPTGVAAMDFQRFGLAQFESRTDQIRKGVQNYVRSIASTAVYWMPERLDEQLSQVAWAAYRLLDPRRRVDPLQRIQLTYPLDRVEEEIPVLPAGELLKTPKPALKGQVGSDDEEGLVDCEIVHLVESAITPPPIQSEIAYNREIVRLLRKDRADEPVGIFSSVRRWLLSGGTLVVVGLLGAAGLTRYGQKPSVETVNQETQSVSNGPSRTESCESLSLSEKGFSEKPLIQGRS